MTVSRTTAVVLLATLIIGMVLGVLGVGAAGRYVMRPDPPSSRPPAPAGFQEHMIRVIEPTDRMQEARVRVVVERAADRNRAMIQDLNVHLRASVDSMRAELAPLLTGDQRERLAQATSRLPPVRGPGTPGGRGPGRGGPPPGPAPDRPPPP